MNPGIHTIPEGVYFAEKAVSSSLLKKLHSTSPAHAYEYFNRRHDDSDETDALRLGKVIDRAILEPSRVLNLAIKPDGMSFATKEGKSWREAQSGKEIIKFSEHEMMKGIVKNVHAHPVIGAILRGGGAVQPSLFAYDRATGLMLKSRFDFLSHGNTILDIKSTITANPAPHGFPREIAKYGYHIQAGFYLDMCIRLGIPKEVFVFAAIEKEPPYAVTAIQLNPDSIARGKELVRRLIDSFAECQRANYWPAYSGQIVQVDLPRWAMRDDAMPESYELEDAV